MEKVSFWGFDIYLKNILVIAFIIIAIATESLYPLFIVFFVIVLSYAFRLGQHYAASLSVSERKTGEEVFYFGIGKISSEDVCNDPAIRELRESSDTKVVIRGEEVEVVIHSASSKSAKFWLMLGLNLRWTPVRISEESDTISLVFTADTAQNSPAQLA